jgi:hypothetical protein
MAKPLPVRMNDLDKGILTNLLLLPLFGHSKASSIVVNPDLAEPEFLAH